MWRHEIIHLQLQSWEGVSWMINTHIYIYIYKSIHTYNIYTYIIYPYTLPWNKQFAPWKFGDSELGNHQFLAAIYVSCRECIIHMRERKKIHTINNWLVVEPTHLKNMIVKLGSSSPNFGLKINTISNHHLEMLQFPGNRVEFQLQKIVDNPGCHPKKNTYPNNQSAWRKLLGEPKIISSTLPRENFHGSFSTRWFLFHGSNLWMVKHINTVRFTKKTRKKLASSKVMWFCFRSFPALQQLQITKKTSEFQMDF